MRLTCPNCDAQYEVPDSAIPAGGRDVQCSNCGHFWYQMPVGSEEDALAGDEDFAPPAAPPAVSDDADEDVISPAAPEAEPAPSSAEPAPLSAEAEEALTSALADAAPQAPEPEAEAEADDAPASGTAARPKSLDESLVALLKEEAEREVEARRQEAARAANLMPETQGDLGLTQPDDSAERARRIADLQGEPPAPEAEAEPDATPARLPARRDLLPDVEAITSTLHGSEAEARQAESDVASLPDLTRQRGGFRSGFSLVMLLLIVGIAAYVAAPQLKAQFPAAAGSIDAYVKAVNDSRVWLDDMMNRASTAISGSSGG